MVYRINHYPQKTNLMASLKAMPEIGETMVHITNNRHGHQSGERVVLRLFTALILCCATSSAQSTIHRADGNTVLNVSATHLLGFEDAKNNSKGTLSVQDGSLQFQRNGKAGAQVNIGSVRDVILGEESRQVGGLPMTLGKAAAPYGGGRVVSLVAHKKYDTLTLEYVDDDGAVHGAIFQLQKGEAEVVKTALVAQGASVNSRQGQGTRGQSGEVSNENK
jgi:hypothetical protein